MYPKVGETCKFVFTEGFSSLDGIYTVISISSLQEWMDLDIDLFETTYEVVGKTEVDLEEDLSILRSEDIYKLKHIETGQVIYVPMSFTYELPDPNIKVYQQIGLAVDIGIFEDPDKVQWIIDEIGQSLVAVAGVEKTPSLFEVNRVWMTEDEYDIIQQDRESTIQNTKNHFTEKQRLIEENTRLRTLVARYEDTLKALNE